MKDKDFIGEVVHDGTSNIFLRNEGIEKPISSS